MPYEIRHHGKVVETHETLSAATRAFWVLTAHELKNGRVADLELDTKTSDCIPALPRAGLPDWAADVLAPYGLVEGEELTTNVCEHGDHYAPEGQRFCSQACQDCEADDYSGELDCSGLCGRRERQL